MRKILVTDYAWADLEEERRILAEAGAELVVAARGDEAELCALAPPVEGILTCWKQVSARVLDSAPGCLSVHRYGIGLDNIDVARATALGMVVTNVPAYCLEEVSDHAMGLMLALSRKIAFYDRQAKSGVYDLAAGAPLYRLSGKTLGLFGAGKIGRTLARKAAAFGMKIIAHDVVPVASPGIEPVSFDDLLARSDFISIHAPLTPDTRRLFWTEIFRKMKPGAFLINTARGEIVDTGALSAALDQNLLAGAALDVFPKEPPSPDDPVLRHPKIVITPHAAFNSVESLIDLRRTAATQMADVLGGRRPEWIVNPEVLSRPDLRARALAGQTASA